MPPPQGRRTNPAPDYDSAFGYCQKIARLAEQLNDLPKTKFAKRKLALFLLSSGLFKGTFDAVDGMRGEKRL